MQLWIWAAQGRKKRGYGQVFRRESGEKWLFVPVLLLKSQKMQKNKNIFKKGLTSEYLCAIMGASNTKTLFGGT